MLSSFADPFDNHALFKTEADARREEEETGEYPAISLEWPVANRTAMSRKRGSTVSSARTSTGATELPARQVDVLRWGA